jgi:coenzyme F420-reducing hydrogenase delta subunit/quinol-cytochrome oxidoreductase complex cytochrome b subunit
LRFLAQHCLHSIEAVFDRAFGANCNPWHHLGALSFFLFWIITASGIYLYAVFDTSVSGVYQSVDYLTWEQWYLGGIMRSLHRYASDAFLVTMGLHFLKEFLRGHYHGFRWFSWLTGVPLGWLAFAAGIGGYWLVWDSLAQFSLTATAEWLDCLPLFGGTLVRNFLLVDNISDRFFSLLIFLHIGIPLLLLLGMWIHILRINCPITNPPKQLAWGTLLGLLLLALLKPALSHEPADLNGVPNHLNLDWFYLFIHPLMYHWSPAALWTLVAAATLLLLLLPWMQGSTTKPVAQVDLTNCNGCGRCVVDCPYAAVILQPRTDGKRHPRQAVVIADLCASCGICAGACPSATPFRSIAELKSGIDMPQLPIGELRTRLKKALAKLTGHGKVIVFGCNYGADVMLLQAPEVAPLSLLCTAMLPPSFIEYALRHGADGVLISGCREGDCEFRFGNRWTVQRINGEREPHLRKHVHHDRLRLVWASRWEQRQLARQLADFRRALCRPTDREASPEEFKQPSRGTERL